jgi:hypothetical protein
VFASALHCVCVQVGCGGRVTVVATAVGTDGFRNWQGLSPRRPGRAHRRYVPPALSKQCAGRSRNGRNSFSPPAHFLSVQPSCHSHAQSPEWATASVIHIGFTLQFRVLFQLRSRPASSFLALRFLPFGRTSCSYSFSPLNATKGYGQSAITGL